MCESFIFGGCNGNDNNFLTPNECYETCGGGVPKIGKIQAALYSKPSSYSRFEAQVTSAKKLFVQHPTSIIWTKVAYLNTNPTAAALLVSTVVSPRFRTCYH